jgi:cyclic 2,3-diphosphoglycerate synthase
LRVLVLVDGEHYPPVTRWGIATARARGYEVLAALFVGGIEKLSGDRLPDLGVPILSAEGDLRAALFRALDDLRPEAVLDLSDEPILGYRERMELAAVALVRGVRYLGSDFSFEPPIFDPPLRVPTIAVIGTGKRTGKTAIGGETARSANAAGFSPVVVAMGRGGPPEPEVAAAGSVDLSTLLDLVMKGRHAASDYLEDAVTTGVTTVGSRRVGGGMAGAPYASNVGEAARIAERAGADLVILEGSGSAVPTVSWDAGILVVPGSSPPEYLGGYLGPYRILLSDLVVFTMCGSPNAGPEKLLALKTQVQRLHPSARFAVTDFEPHPLGAVRDKTVFLTTTAPAEVARKQQAHLEATYGCRVVGWSDRLADRAGLTEDLEGAPPFELLLTELKAAAVDVASEIAVARGAGVVFLDNRAVTTDGGPELRDQIAEIIDLAVERGRGRTPL